MIHVNYVGFQFVNIGGYEANRPNGTGDYLLLYLRCSAEIWIDGIFQKIPPDTYFIFKKDTPQLYRKLDGNFINDWMHFDFDTYDEYFEKLNIPLNTPVYLPNNSELETMISEMVLEYFSEGKNSEHSLSEKADLFFHKFSHSYQFYRTHTSRENDYLIKFTKLRQKIQSRQYRLLNVEEAAASMNLSVSHFQHLYKRFFGNSIYKDIIQTRIEYAKNLLVSTNFSIGQIAVICDYDNVEHFSRIFKKYTGCSPRQYRTQTKKP